MKYALLVFDWDGTIIDSPAAIVECIREASREMGLRVPERERAAHVIGLGLRESLQQAVPDLPAERYSEFVALYRKNFLAREDSMPLFRGMQDLLGSLAKTHRLAIATGKSRRGLDRALDATGLAPLFASSRCADETAPKPDPAMLRELMEEFGIDETQVLMIGDTTHDLGMASAAGVDALAVTYGAHPEQGLRAYPSLDYLPTVEALREWLQANA